MDVVKWLNDHVGLLVIIYGVFANMMSALPTPNMNEPDKSPRWYIAAWSTGNFLALNIPRIFPKLRLSKGDKP